MKRKIKPYDGFPFQSAPQPLFLAQSAKLVENPKLVKMVDPGKAANAHRICLDYLEEQSPGERRRRMAMSMITSIAFSMIVIAGLYITVLVWRGFL